MTFCKGWGCAIMKTDQDKGEKGTMQTMMSCVFCEEEARGVASTDF